MAKEEISEIEKKSRVIQITGKVTQETKDLFDELKEAGAYDTFGMFMEALLERYQNPMKVNKGNEAKISELLRTIDELKSKIREKEADNAAACESVNEEREKFEELKSEHNAALARIEQLEREKSTLEQTASEYDTLKTETKGCISVPVSDLDMKCLQYMAERECRIRKRNDITPAKFFMYAVKEMLINGNKFSIDSVPDAVIAKFKAEIDHGQ